MFFALFSDRVYDEGRWPEVFQIENWIHAAIRADWQEMVGLPHDELISLLRGHVKSGLRRTRQEEFPDDSFITAVLEHEVVRMAQQLADLQAKNPTEESDTLGPRFKLNAQRLHECMARSEDFRKLILKGKKGGGKT